jgi:hypothetical protein
MFNDWLPFIEKFSIFSPVMLQIFHKDAQEIAHHQLRNTSTGEGIYGISNLLWNAGVSRPDSSRLVFV